MSKISLYKISFAGVFAVLVSFQNCAKSGPMQKDNAGSNEQGRTTPGAPVITQQPRTQTVLRGEAFSLSVTASGSGLSYQWIKNGTNLIDKTEPVLTIDEATTADEGSYQVKVSNSIGFVVSQVATISFESVAAPVIRSPPTSQIAFLGQSVVFRVEAEGRGLNYQWYRDGVPMDGETDPTLVFNDVGPEHDGLRFRVQVTNGVDTVVSNEVVMVYQFETYSIGKVCGYQSDRLCRADNNSQRSLNGDYLCQLPNRTNNMKSIAKATARAPKGLDRSFASRRADGSWFIDSNCNECQYYLTSITCYK